MKLWVYATLLGVLLLSCSGDTVVLRVQVIIPATVPTIEAGELHLSLWAYDPGIADVGATLADRVRAPFEHIAGQRNIILMRVMGHVPGGWRYYISVEGCESTPDGQVAVLWDGIEGTGAPAVVEMRYRTTPVPCQAAAV
jgi:hypothetical protein